MGNILHNSLDVTYEDFLKSVFGMKHKPEWNALKSLFSEIVTGKSTLVSDLSKPLRDRGIWVWYCQRLGLNQFLDLADEVISSARQGEQIAPVDPDSLPKAAQNISAPSLRPLCG